MYSTDENNTATDPEEGDIRPEAGKRSPLLKSTCKVIGRSPGSGPGGGGSDKSSSNGSRGDSTAGSGASKNQFSKSVKATIATLTVSASIIGAFSTLAGFTSSLLPIARPAPVMATTLGPPAVGSGPNSTDFAQLIVTAGVGDLAALDCPLAALGPNGRSLGQCPLKSTTMNARLSGYVARVDVTQVFTNPFKEKIEAVYNLPLSNDSAVDDMTIQIGARKIKGEIKTRQQAKAIYEQARSRGNAAALLDQERTNIFTQHVANIEPGKSIVVNVSYVELLKFEDGRYTFTMPTTIGPRFNPGCGGVKGHAAQSVSSVNLNAALIGAPVSNTTPMQNLSINVDVEAGMPIKSVTSKTFPIIVDRQDAKHSLVSLRKSAEVPNKDFILTYEVDKPQSMKSGYLTYRDLKAGDKDGYATFMLLPPAKISADMAAPKEMIFLIDCSGSQSGMPIQKAKDTLSYIIDHMNADDTIQILAFNDEVATLSDQPIKVNPLSKAVARQFVSRLTAHGGTWMGPAVERVLHSQAKPIDDISRLRIVTFMTDGQVGNDLEILNLIKSERADSRWFSFGTGSSVNHLLIDGIAKLGGGEADYVNLNDKPEVAGKKFYDRIASPSLTNVKLKAEGIKLYDVQPGQISDVWANKPLYFTARYKDAGRGKVVLSGYSHGHPYEQSLDVVLPEKATRDSAIEKIWARQKIEALTESDLDGLSSGNINAEVQSAITSVALQHRLMSDFTSFVAIEEAPASNGPALTVPVHNMAPEGETDNAIADDVGERRPVCTRFVPPPYQPIAPQLQQTVTAASLPQANYVPQNYAITGGTGMLQGATNGTIGPQGADATCIAGINTCGTVRVNNLANLEALLNILANGWEILGIAWGGATVVIGLRQAARKENAGYRRIFLGMVGAASGLALPGLINWLVAIARDAALFN